MTTIQIARNLVGFCRRGEYLEAQRELYASDAVSLEPDGPESVTHGLEAIHAKTRRFTEEFEILENIVGDPIVADPFFACTMTLKARERKSGGMLTMAELCVFQVADGKIAREQFFYRPQPR